jgi:O-antigen/teichoic acid export membrane protein
MLDKLKQLTKDTAVYGTSTILGRFLNFLLIPLYTNVFLPAEYGVVANVYAYIAILNIIYLYGMDSAYLRFASTLEVGSKKDNFSTPFYSVALTSIFFSVLIVLFKDVILKGIGVPFNYSYIIFYFALILFFDSIAVTPFIGLRLERKAKKFATIKIINILTNVVLNVVLILKFKMGIKAVFISNLAASLLTIILLFPFIFKNLAASFNKELFKRLFKFGIPYLPAGLATMFIQVIDRPILQKLTDLKTLGIYQANYRLGIFMMLFVSMFQFAWQPFFMANSKEENAKEIFSKVFTYFTFVSSIILIILSLYIDDLAKFQIMGKSMIGSAYWSGLGIVPIVLLGYMFNGLYVNLTAGIYIEEKSKYVPLVTGIGAAVNVIVNFALIPVWGIMGAAFATLASYVVMAAGLYFVTQKFYHVKYELDKIFKIFASVFIVGVIFYFLRYYNQFIFGYKVCLLLFFFFLILLLKVFDKREMNYLKMFLLHRKI